MWVPVPRFWEEVLLFWYSSSLEPITTTILAQHLYQVAPTIVASWWFIWILKFKMDGVMKILVYKLCRSNDMHTTQSKK